MGETMSCRLLQNHPDSKFPVPMPAVSTEITCPVANADGFACDQVSMATEISKGWRHAFTRASVSMREWVEVLWDSTAKKLPSCTGKQCTLTGVQTWIQIQVKGVKGASNPESRNHHVCVCWDKDKTCRMIRSWSFWDWESIHLSPTNDLHCCRKSSATWPK